MLDTSVKESALAYASAQHFSVFPVHGVMPDGTCTCGTRDCPSAGKHPATRNGLKDATADGNRIQNLFASPRPHNVAIATGAVSGIFVLDVDGMEGEMALAALEAANTPLPRTLTSLTGRGRHMIFRHPGVKVKTRSSKLGPKLDIRGDGGYIVAPPSLHHTGAFYQWDNTKGLAVADAPQWLIDLVKEDATPAANDRIPMTYDPQAATGSWTADDVAGMLNTISPDVSYDEWINVGMALHEGGHPMAHFNNWSARGVKYKGVRDVEMHWRSFKPGGGITMGTLVQKAMLGGWQHPAPPVTEHTAELIEIGRRAAETLLTRQSQTVQSSAGGSIHLDFDAIPGLIGETVKWILSNAQKPQPELALLNTVTALGAVFGRRYRSPLDTRTNIYTVGLAGTAAGKNHSKKSIKSLMVAAGLDEFLGGEAVISGNGILAGIVKQPSQIMHLDEFGMVLEAIMDKRGSSHMKLASKVITELYSNSGEKYYGGQYADKKVDTSVIAAPNLCIYGISTVEKYTGSLNRDVVTSGELNRFVVFRASKDNPKRRRGILIEAPPEWLVAAWRAFKPDSPQHAMIEVTPRLVPWDGLQDRIDDMGDFEDAQIDRDLHGAGALWGRYRENVIKVAMIFAVARNHMQPGISPADLDIAEALVRQSVDYMVSMVAEHLADSQHEKDCKDIVRIIKRKGGRISKTDLCKSTQRLDGRQREAALASLLDQDLIVVDAVKETAGAGRKPVIYRIR